MLPGWALSEKPFYLQLIATMAVAAIMAALITHSLGQRGESAAPNGCAAPGHGALI